MGQTIKVRNDTTKELFEVTVIGPQQTQLTAMAGSPEAAAN
jgi:hypothetical protein